MSQSVNVLSCECPYCLNCAGESQNYKENTICTECFVANCQACKWTEKTGKPAIKRSVLVETQEMMLTDDDILFFHFNLLERQPHLSHRFSESYKQLKRQTAQGDTRCLEHSVSCQFRAKGESLKITFYYLVRLSDNGEGLHLKI